MPLEWAGSSPDLLLVIDRESGEPLRTQVERRLRDAIRGGRLRSGERLPSSRTLARQLGLSRGLVQECYEQLHAEGYLVSRPGAGTYVASGTHLPQDPAKRRAAEPELLADFQSGVPDLRSFPVTDWLWAMREAARVTPASAFSYGDARGSAALREVLAGYLRRVRACVADPEQMVICSGYAQGLGLALHALARSGIRTVAYEDPGSPTTTRSAAAWAGMAAVPVPVDDQGIDVEALAATDARVVIVTPAHQWPTGVVLAPRRRLALIDWAVRRDAVIIEDDYDAEFRYDRDPVGTLQGLAPDRVIAAGTVSKSLAPALRIGWLLCPPGIRALVTVHKHLSDRGSPTLDQLALATLIESGRYDRHLRRMRARYAARRSALVAALAEHAPRVVVTGLAAGFHAVAHLGPAADERAVVAAARERAVGLYGMSACRTSRAAAPAQLVLGFGNVSDDALTAGIAVVGDLLRGDGGGPHGHGRDM
ncbi:MocR-like pyridoxine biosynthesis transcription factor PdxR [Streptomyces aurantiogriseus]|uniref:GntR family transcriptional regulator n=1 Tax=Streptomyces aurantiogriseus TaxID=66870 RepID=A0A918FN69_9ACTN|nr:PLP-dependent aminotransferase family protein [Streptomyces aurantiogriseus]GGR58618.1 GntR family transcriptional regulator [Streptomyces aurantiogriseus]